MAFSIGDFLPIRSAKSSAKTKQLAVPGKTRAKGGKLFKVASQALGFTPSDYGPRAQFESSPYDFDRIIQAIDTDSYVKQAFNKYKELTWKEGWDIVGESEEAVAYLYQRLDLMELVMRRPFQELLYDISDQLTKFGNAFVVKARSKDIARFVNVPITPIAGMDPLAGYYVLPAETVQIKRDRHNNILGYRQDLSEGIGRWIPDDESPQWQPNEVIHFSMDKKPGRVFGTPFMVAVLDDVIALRQLEEDVQNLVHKELFPLYKYHVGTETDPAEDAEILRAADELNNLRTDGGLVLPERHDVDVIGGKSTALDASSYLDKFLGRVCVGLGLSPHHLGIMMEGGNRSVTDRLDAALYDKIKTYQGVISDMIQLHVFTELLLEGGFDPITHPIATGISDRCIFRFREIDVDSQIKRETHELQKYAMNVTTDRELRLSLNMSPDRPEEETHAALQARMAIAQTDAAAEAQARFAPPPTVKTPDGGQKAVPPKNKPDAATPASKGIRNPPNNQKGLGNKVRPTNQFGRRTSPNVRHSVDEDWLSEVESLLGEDDEGV